MLMKKGIWLTVVLVFFIIFIPISSAEYYTKLSELLDKKDKLIIKNHYDIGSIAGEKQSLISIEAVVYYEFGLESQRLKGLYVNANDKVNEEEESYLIDWDELNALSKGLENMSSLMKKYKDLKVEYFQSAIMTKSELIIGFYQYGLEQTLYIKGGGYKDPDIALSTEDLVYIKSLIDKSIVILTNK